jgi:WD40 repeat protein
MGRRPISPSLVQNTIMFGKTIPTTLAVEQLPSGLALLKTLQGHKEWIFELTWSPDGMTLASGSWDKTIRLWDVEAGETRLILSGHTCMVFAIAWSPDGGALVSGASDGTILLWDSQNGELRQTLGKHGAAVYSIAWSSDGQTFASGSQDIMWNT